MICSAKVWRVSALTLNGIFVPRVEDVEIGEAVAAELREGGRGGGRRAFLTDDQLAVVDADGLVLHQVAEGKGAAHGCRDQAHLLPVELGHQPGALGR